MDFDSLFGVRLKEVRTSLGLNQDAAAATCGVSREMWGRYERGAAAPGGKVLAAFAATGADMNYVLAGIRSAPPPLQAIDQNILLQIVSRLNEMASAARKRWPEERKLALAIEVYNYLAHEGGAADEQKIDRTLRLVVNQ